jgi:hypothetical protein
MAFLLCASLVTPCALGYAVRSPIRSTASVPVGLQRRVLRRASALLLQEGAGDDVIGDGGMGNVRWVSIDVSAGEQEPSGDERTSVMPLFPLGAAYLPHTSPVLNIFEPRYRAMCVPALPAALIQQIPRHGAAPRPRGARGFALLRSNIRTRLTLGFESAGLAVFHL